MKNIFVTAVVTVGLISALLLAHLAQPSKPAAVVLPDGFSDGLVASVTSPTALAFTPDGRMLIATQPGRLLVRQNGTVGATPALDLTGQVCSNSERGMLGVAVDPDFTANRYVYVYYTFKKHGVCEQNTARSPVNRVSRFTLSDQNLATNETVLVDGIPSPNGNHNAGDLHFGKDGYLYVSVGDGGCDYLGNSGCAGDNDVSRDTNVLLGKILRVTRDGGIPPDNPNASTGDVCGEPGGDGRTSAGRTCRETFASGLRNPFRMAFDPDATGTSFFINDVGQGAWEEVDRGVSGADYGWNLCEGRHDNPDRAGVVDCSPPPAGMSAPVHEYAHSTGCSSITGGAFVPDDAGWPARYYDSYLYGDYVCGKMFELAPAAGGGFTRTTFMSGLGYGGPTSMTFGPYGDDQALYYTTYTDGGQIRRIAYTAGNRAPAADIAGDQLWDETLTVGFDGSGSNDPDGDTLTYLWDFGDGTTAETSTATTSHAYATTGRFTATLRVRDSRGALSEPRTVEVFPGNTPPEPRITSPGTAFRFRVGQAVTVSGTATDPEDGPVPETGLGWRIVRHHDASHTHPYDSGSGGGITITAPPPEDLRSTGPGNHLEVRLTATDSSGLRGTVSQELQPRRVSLTFDTAPVNLRLRANGARFRAPRTMVSWHGYRLQLEAPRRQRGESGRRWAFKRWSDGRGRVHTIATPDSGTTYTATYRRLRR